MAGLKFDIRNLTSEDGTPILAEAIGDPSKPHVVFAHGMAADMTFFDALFERPEIQSSIYAVRYDSRGHGRSGRPKGETAYLGERYVEDFQAVSDAFNLKRPFFVGWSLGAAIATDLCAASVPLSGIIQIGPVPYVGGEYASNILPFRYVPHHDLVPHHGLVRGLLSSDDVPLALSARVQWADKLVAPDRLPHVPYQDIIKWIGAATQFTPEACAGCLFRPQDPEDLHRAGANGMPLLIIWGKEDQQMDGQKTYDIMSPKFTICEKVALDGVGHMPFYEEPTLTTKHLLDFVHRHSKQT